MRIPAQMHEALTHPNIASLALPSLCCAQRGPVLPVSKPLCEAGRMIGRSQYRVS